MLLLAEYIKTRLLPWVQTPSHERFVVANPVMEQASLPAGVRLTKQPIKGRRVIIKSGRFYKNTRNGIARWPDSGLSEVNYHKIVVVLAGNFKYQIGHYVIECGEGYFIVVPRGTPATKGEWVPYCAPNSFCRILTIILHRQAIQCLITHSSAQASHHIQENILLRNEQLVMLINTVFLELTQHGGESDEITRQILQSFLAVLQREIRNEQYITPGLVLSHRPVAEEGHSFENELTHYVQTHLDKDLTLNKAAADMYLSRTQFARKVREETGRTFIAFVTDYRLEEAKILLRDSDWTINAIAGFLGYKTPSYFRKIFSERLNMTPGQYRDYVRHEKADDF